MTRPLSALWNRISSAANTFCESRRRKPQRLANRQRVRRAFLESLEERRVLATFDLVGTSLKLGVNDNGSYENGTRTAEYLGNDYFYPGTPYHEITLSAGGSNFINSATQNFSGLPGSSTNTSSGSTLSARFTGTAAGLSIVRNLKFSSTGSVVEYDVTITNTTASTINNVAFIEAGDPDQGTPMGSGPVTVNDVVTVGAGRFVRASSTSTPHTVGFGSADPRASYSAEAGWPFFNPFAIINTPEDPNGAAGDVGIGIAFNFGNLAPGESVATQYYMVFATTAAGADSAFGAAVNVLPSAEANGPYSVGEGSSVVLSSASSADTDGSIASILWDLNNDGTYETPGASPTFSAAGIDGPATRTVRMVVTDNDGGRDFDTATVTINNQPPQNVSAGGTYTINEGSSLTLTGSATDPAGAADPLTYAWDVNGDNNFVDATGANPTLTWSQLNALGISDNGTRNVRVRVSDGDSGTTTSASVLLTINNAAPSLVASLSSAFIDENSSTTLTGTITDLGNVDTFTLSLNWGDPLSPNNVQPFALGTTALTVAADGINWNPTTRVFSLPHQYLDDNPTATTSDQYTISTILTDDDGDSMPFGAALIAGPNSLGYGAFDHAFENINLQVGQPGVFTIFDNDDDGSTVFSLGANSFQTEFGPVSQITVGTNGHFNAGATSFSVLQSDWYTRVDADDLILGKYEDLDNDLVADRLIIEWSDVFGCCATPPRVTFQAILEVNTGSAAGEIIYNYPSITHGNSKNVSFQIGGSVTIQQGNLINPEVRNGQAIVISKFAAPTDFRVEVKDVAPAVAVSLDSNAINENGSVTLRGTVTDVGTLDTFNLNLDWGHAGSPQNVQSFSLGTSALTVADDGIDWNPATREFSLTHLYVDDSPSGTSSDQYTIAVSVTDDDTLRSSTIPNALLNVNSTGYRAHDYAFENIDLQIGEPDVFVVFDNDDDGSINMNLGAHGFTVNNLQVNNLQVGTNGNLSVSGFGTFYVLGADWYTGGSSTDVILGKYEDVNQDNIADRLILEWSDLFGCCPQPPQITFQAILELNTGTNPGTVIYNYPNIVNPRTPGATVGLSSNGSFFVQNGSPPSPHVASGEAILIAKEAPAKTYVTVSNLVPTNVSAGGPYVISEGGSLSLSASASDAAGPYDPLSYSWDINGDGTYGDAIGANPTLTWSQLNGLGIVDNGTRNVRVRVSDDDTGVTTSSSVLLTIDNVAPTVAVGLSSDTINENDSTTLTGTITDPGTLDTFTVSLNWGDSLSPPNTQTFTLGTTALTFAADGINWNPATRVFSLPHQYLDDNPSNSDSDPYTITVNVTDDDGGTLAEPATIDVTVNNVAPSVGLSLPSTTISENGSTTLTGTISDVGTLDTFTLNLNWGDTLSLPVTQTFTLGTTALSVAEDGINWNPATRVFSLPHQYLDDNPSASSSDPYTITVNVTDDDGSSLAEPATIGLTVENLDPVAAAQTVATTEDAPITPINVLADLTDVGTLDTHSAVAASGVVVGGGLYTLAANGSLTFDPNGEYEYLSVGQSVSRTISFSIVDDDGGLSTETVTITVNGVNDAPLANPDTNSTTEHAPVTTAVLGNDTDVDQADVKVLTTFSIASMTFNVNGTAIPVVTATVTDNDGAIVFDPGNDFDFLPAGATATVIINYTMRDGRSEPLPTEITASSSSTLTITINGENDAPIGNGDSYTTAEDTPLIIAAPGVLGNDTDVDFGTTLTVHSFMQPTHGGVAVNANGSFTYTPYANYNGPDSFRYRITDGTAQTSLITVTLTVTAVDDFDFGDAPASYGVASHSEGAGFIGGPANSGPLLGTRDFETANQASPNADGDDLNSTDDEDGVSFSSTTLVPRFNTTVTVNASAAGKLDAWIDFNRNNVFDVGEKIANGLSVVAGSNTLVVPVPDNLTSGATFARFRLSSAGISLPTGLAADGEVEDYKLSIQALAINSAVVIDDPENPGSENPDVLVINGTDGFYDAIAVRMTKAATLTAPAIVTVYIAPYVSVGSFPLNSFGRIVVFGRGGLDAISIESPIDKPTTLYGDAGNDSISGGLGPDIIIGGDGIDTMTGNAGDDIFIGGLGNDTIAGGAGFDRFVEMVGSATVTNNTSKVGTSSDTFSQIEQIELTGTPLSEAFTLTGVNLIVLLNAGDGADTLAYTGDGNVVLTNGLLTRTQGTATYNLDLTTIESLRLSGGQSNDSFNLTAWTKSLILSGGAGTDTVVATNDVNYTLSDTFLMRTGLLPIAQSTMENALLTGGGSDNTFDISSWTKAATLTGNGGTDKLVVADNAATMTLTNALLTRTSRGNATLNGIEVAELTGGAANNSINASTFSGQLKIDGAAGNDTITGGTGPSLLLGGLGNDVLRSGTGRTVLIGGQGLDRLTGNTNDDLLIAGQTLHDNNAAALAAILAEWASVANDYATRVANLTGPGDLLESTQVTHDNAVDVLLGGAGEDLFFAKQVATPGSPKDTYTDKTSGESIF